MNWQYRADWTGVGEYLIDLDRGSVYHSKTASQGQRNRLFTHELVGGHMKHFSYPQAADFFKKMKTAELYLGLLRQQYQSNNSELSMNLVVESSRLLPLTCVLISECSTTHSTHLASQLLRIFL